MNKIWRLRGVQQAYNWFFHRAAKRHYLEQQNDMKTPQEYMKPRPGKDFGFAHYCYKFWYQYCLTPGGWTEHGTSQQEAKQEANRRVKISFYKTLKRQPK